MKLYFSVLLSFIYFVEFCSCCELTPKDQEKLAVKVFWAYSDINGKISEDTANVIASVCDNYAQFGETAMTMELHIFSYVCENNGEIVCESGKSCEWELYEACGEIVANTNAFPCCTDTFEECYQKLNVDVQKIDECFAQGLNGPGGQRLLQSRQLMSSNNVEEDSLSTITFNDQYSECTAEAAIADFTGTACQLYNEDYAPTTVC